MRVSRIIKHKEGYSLLCQLTVEDMDILPRELTVAKLMEIELPIENMTSLKGFWFRPCFERHWGMRGEYLVEPPKAEDGGGDGR